MVAGELPVQTEAELWSTLHKIKARDPSIYDQSTQFYTEADDGDEDGLGDEDEQGR